MYGLYGLYSQQFFLPVWQIEQNVISHSSDVRLNPFEVRWVRDDEAYAPVCFEVIPNTLIFGLNLTPGPDSDHTFPLKGFWTHKS
jgi:hypothetical protein